MAWDLNAFGHSLSMRLSDGSWDPSNAEALIRHALAANQTAVLKTLQLGNEPGHYSAETRGAPGAAAHGRDFLKLRRLLDSLFAHDPAAAPNIQGPDVCFGRHLNCSVANCTSGFDKCADLEYLETLLEAAAGSIDEVTVHNYGLSGPSHGPPYVPHQCSLENLLTPALYEQGLPDSGRPGMLAVLEGWRDAQLRHAPRSKIVLSETATTGDGGCVNLSNTFAAGFFWVDQLGLTAAAGYWKVYRQDLVGFSGIDGGSSYALAGPPGWVGGGAAGPQGPWPTGALVANPDFFTSVLWKRLMGPRVLWSSLSASAVPRRPGRPEGGGDADSGVRAYAACSHPGSGGGGGIAVAFLNPSAGLAVLQLPPTLAVAPRTAWVLSSGGSGAWTAVRCC